MGVPSNSVILARTKKKQEETKRVEGVGRLLIYACTSANVFPAISITEAEDQRRRGTVGTCGLTSLELACPAGGSVAGALLGRNSNPAKPSAQPSCQQGASWASSGLPDFSQKAQRGSLGQGSGSPKCARQGEILEAPGGTRLRAGPQGAGGKAPASQAHRKGGEHEFPPAS